MIRWLRERFHDWYVKHFRDNKELKEIIAGVIVVALIATFCTGMWIGATVFQEDCEESRVDRAEKYIDFFESGKKIKPMTGVIKNDTTVEEAIKIYRKYGQTAQFSLGVVLGDICG